MWHMTSRPGRWYLKLIALITYVLFGKLCKIFDIVYCQQVGSLSGDSKNGLAHPKCGQELALVHL
jgi:hypothetical protein